jgi:hypothetical protein
MMICEWNLNNVRYLGSLDSVPVLVTLFFCDGKDIFEDGHMENGN